MPLFKVHNYAEARKACPLGKVPLLKFSGGGADHILLPTGQHIRQKRKDRTISARQLKKEMKEYRRNERRFQQVDGIQVAPDPKAELANEVTLFSQMPKEEIVRMVSAGELPFNVAVGLEQSGLNRQEVLLALSEIAKPEDLERVDSEAPAQPLPADSACPVQPSA